MPLPLSDLTALFAAIVDIESVSRSETRLADEVEAALAPCRHLKVLRDGDALVARTDLGRVERVIIAGHLDTVPVANNLPSRLADGVLHGRGSVDMKGGIAVMLALAAELVAPARDVTWVFYDREEIAAAENGLGRLAANHPSWLAGASLAILMEPTSAQVEGGCQGTIRVDVTTTGRAAHSARSWLGHNAIHDMAEVLARVVDFPTGEVVVDGLTYREGLNATLINGGVAGNVIPDRASVQVNYRFAPDKTSEQAVKIIQELFTGFEQHLVDVSPAARPGLQQPAAVAFLAAAGDIKIGPKYGWTDVARFAELGIAALNFGPGDPNKAHTDDECCPISDVETCASVLRRWLATPESAD